MIFQTFRNILFLCLLFLIVSNESVCGQSFLLANGSRSNEGNWPAKNGLGVQAAANFQQVHQLGPRQKVLAHLQINPAVLRKGKKLPPQSFRSLVHQSLTGLGGMFLGAFAGIIIGGIVGGTISGPVQPGQWRFGGESAGFAWGGILGSSLGAGLGVWMGGNTDQFTASLPLVMLGSLLGVVIGTLGAIATFGILFLGPILGVIGGGMLVFHWTRRPWKNLEEVEGAEETSVNAHFGILGSNGYAPTPMGAGTLPTTFSKNLFSIRF